MTHVYGPALILVLLLMSGLIAYLGDWVGRRIGRHRLTLWGLRPHHTSIVITIIAGVLIATGTLGVLTATSRDFRTALFHIREIQAELATSQGQLKVARREIARQQQQVDELAARIAAKSDEYRTLTDRIQQLSKARDEAQARLVAAQQEKSRVETEYQQIKASYETTQADLQAAQQALDAERKKVEEAKRQSDELSQNVATLEKAREQINQRLADLYVQYQQLQVDVDRMRQGNMAYRAHEIVLSKVLPGGGTLDEVRSRLYDFLAAADQQAVRRGAAVPGRPGYGLKLPSQQVFDEAVAFLAGKQGEWVVRAVSSSNTLVGEPVLVYFEMTPRRLAFRAGEVIASRTIDPRQEKVEEAILTLLQQVNSEAIQRGMITDVDGTVGQADGQEFTRAVSQVRAATGLVKVEAVALWNTWTTAGPLRIGLRIAGGAGS
ncbi:MAG: DUF3084 domain-containing protein [Limnochordaceae bacterium]|nr:DUF3084 domain-containing protein [Limnochordaceae bacterium]